MNISTNLLVITSIFFLCNVLSLCKSSVFGESQSPPCIICDCAKSKNQIFVSFFTKYHHYCQYRLSCRYLSISQYFQIYFIYNIWIGLITKIFILQDAQCKINYFEIVNFDLQIFEFVLLIKYLIEYYIKTYSKTHNPIRIHVYLFYLYNCVEMRFVRNESL